MADRCCEMIMSCGSAVCRVCCRYMSTRGMYITQFVVYAILQTMNLGVDVGMFFDVFSANKRCDDMLAADSGGVNGTSETKSLQTPIYCNRSGNFSLANLDDSVKPLEIFEWCVLLITGIGGAIFITHLCTLLPNLCHYCVNPDFEQEIDDDQKYYQNIISIHTVFLIVESILHDIPMTCLAVELCVLYFNPTNCWECSLSEDGVRDLAVQRSSLWFGLKVATVAFVSIYKGLLPLYMWIGNPFCWSCYPLRFCIAAPAALVFMVMVLCPSMGMVQFRLIKVAPAMKGSAGGVADIIWSIGIVFYVLLIVMAVCYYCFKNFIMDACPCFAWCADDSKKKKKKKEDGKAGCLCFG